MTHILTEMFPTKEQQLLAVVKPLGALQIQGAIVTPSRDEKTNVTNAASKNDKLLEPLIS